MRRSAHLLLLGLLLALGCAADYDVAEVAPEEHLDTEHHHGEDGECTDCDDAHWDSGDEQHGDVHSEHQEEFTEGPSGHSHGAGERNHGTQWFFNQPWAADFIWGKLVRDGAIFLVLSAVIFMVTRRRRR